MRRFTFADMAAVVIGFNAAITVGVVDVKSVKVSTDGFHRSETLLTEVCVKKILRGKLLGKRWRVGLPVPARPLFRAACFCWKLGCSWDPLFLGRQHS